MSIEFRMFPNGSTSTARCEHPEAERFRGSGEMCGACGAIFQLGPTHSVTLRPIAAPSSPPVKTVRGGGAP